MTRRIGFKENKKCDYCENMAWVECEDKHYCGVCWDKSDY
jgi:hypothetical protein